MNQGVAFVQGDRLALARLAGGAILRRAALPETLVRGAGTGVRPLDSGAGLASFAPHTRDIDPLAG